MEEGPGREKRENRDAGHKALLSGIILLACMAAFAAGVFSLGTVALLGACLCILTGCITCRKAFQSMDWSTITVLAGAMGFSRGFKERRGGLNRRTHAGAFRRPEANPALMCAALIILASILGNVMSHTATVAVLTPIAISLAAAPLNPAHHLCHRGGSHRLQPGLPPLLPLRPLTMTLCAGYRFLDYSKVGGALNVSYGALRCRGDPSDLRPMTGTSPPAEKIKLKGTSEMRRVAIVSAVRTGIGKYGGQWVRTPSEQGRRRPSEAVAGQASIRRR